MTSPNRQHPPGAIEAAPSRSRLILRVRRSAVIVLVLFLFVGAAASWLAAGAVGQRVLADSVDRRLDRAVEEAAVSSGDTPVEEIRFRGRVEVVDGHIQPAGATASASPVADLVRRAAASGEIAEGNVTLDGRRARVQVRPLAAESGVTPVLVGVTDLHPDAVGRLVLVLAAVQILVLVALCGVAYLVARGSSRVVEDLFRNEDRLMLAVAHEIRTPLSHILVAMDEGAAGVIPAEAAFREAAGEVEGMSRLIDDLVETARVMAGAVPLAREAVSLDQVAEEGARAGARGEADVVVETRPVTVVGSPGLLRLAISNLVRNAVRHGRPDSRGRVTVTVDDTGVSVTDEGPGIAVHQLAKLCRDVPRGLRRSETGIGLPVAAWVADVHGGQLELANRPGGGFEARLSLPVETDGPEPRAEQTPELAR